MTTKYHIIMHPTLSNTWLPVIHTCSLDVFLCHCFLSCITSPFSLVAHYFFDFFKGISNFPSMLHLSHTLYNILNTDMRISVTKWCMWVVQNPYFHKEADYLISFSQYILCLCVCLSVYMFVWLAMSSSPHPIIRESI